MPIGTSDGETYDTHLAYLMAQPRIDVYKKNYLSIDESMERTPESMMRQKQIVADPKNIFNDQGTIEDYDLAGKGPQAPQKGVDAIELTRPNQVPSDSPFSFLKAGAILNRGIDATIGALSDPVKTVEDTVSGIGRTLALPGDVLSGKVQPGSVQEIERAADLAGLMVAGPAPVAAKMADGTLGSFAGVTSKTIDKGALETAQAAEKAGTHPDEIWQKTGFFKGADSRWRYEIPDEGAKINERGFNKTSVQAAPQYGGGKADFVSIKPPEKNFFGEPSRHQRLPDILDHPELYEAYPSLKNIKVVPMEPGREAIGSMSLSENTLKLKDELDSAYARSVILHEVQHAIQREEGFALGGSRAQFLDKKMGWDEAGEFYKRLMGEVEARNVQARMDFNEARRWFNSPRSTEDRPRFIQIFK